MKRWLVCVVGLSALLGGCFGLGDESDTYMNPSKPLDKMSQDELCSFYTHYRENPDLSQHARDVAIKQARSKGCAV